MSRGGRGNPRVSLLRVPDRTSRFRYPQGCAHAKDRRRCGVPPQVPNLRFFSRKKCLFCFAESLVLFLSSPLRPAVSNLPEMQFLQETPSTGFCRIPGAEIDGRFCRAVAICFCQSSVIYWLFVMQRYAPQSNREERNQPAGEKFPKIDFHIGMPVRSNWPDTAALLLVFV